MGWGGWHGPERGGIARPRAGSARSIVLRLFGGPVGAVLLHQAVFDPGMGAVAAPKRAIAAPVTADVMPVAMFARSTAFLGYFFPAFHIYQLLSSITM